MKDITIFRHIDGTARGIVWEGGEPSDDEANPEGATYITYTIMPDEFCAFVKNGTKEKVHELLDKFIMR